MFYDRFYKLCQLKNVTPTQVARDIGIRQSTVSMWKKQGTTPRYGTLRKLAEYFNVDWTELVPEEDQGTVIAAHVIEGAGLTVKDKDGNIIHQGSGLKWCKMTEAEQYRAGFLQFRCEEDRIVHFYNKLTDEGRIAAGGCFFRHLDKGTLSEVADYVMNLSENPLYQRTEASQPPAAPPAGTDESPSEGVETPPEGK